VKAAVKASRSPNTKCTGTAICGGWVRRSSGATSASILRWMMFMFRNALAVPTMP